MRPPPFKSVAGKRNYESAGVVMIACLFHHAYYLASRSKRYFSYWQFRFSHAQGGAANPANCRAHKEFIRSGFRNRRLSRDPRTSVNLYRRVQYARFHHHRPRPHSLTFEGVAGDVS
jgi:hypothetical protein